MKISSLTERVIFQKNEAHMDAVGNHINEWTDWYTCSAHAEATSYQQRETEHAGMIIGEDGLVFTVRYCSELKDLDGLHYRIVFCGNTYNIISVDMSSFDHKSIKVSCEKERQKNVK